MKLAKTSRLLFFVLIFFKSFNLSADMAMVSESEMAPTPMVEINKVISHYKNMENSKKISADQKNILTLAEVASEVLSVTAVQLNEYGLNTDDQRIKSVVASMIIVAIQKSIREKQSWEKVSSQQLAKINQIVSAISENLGENSYAWAWVKFQQGDKEKPKMILNTLFDANYEKTMKMKNLGFNGSSPMTEGMTMSKILTPLSTPDENKEREKKLNKMRTHISNMPDLQIMT